jgi:mannan endo-1,4-beta-mannosidase
MTGTGGRTSSGGATSASGVTQGSGGLRTGGRTGAGGATGSGGSLGTGGATTGGGGTQGTGGRQGIVTRPSYNTGTGFFVLSGKLYDANGVEFRIRGVNRNHYDVAAPGIPKTHANTERTVLFFNGEYGSSATRNVQVMQQDMINNHVVPMPGNWEGTCDESAATLTTIVDHWVAQASSYTPLDKYTILNIANEWGPSNSTVWRDSSITAIQRLRAAGYTCTISVTSGGCGQDNADLAKYAQAVFDADPQKNVIFDQHIYGNWGYDSQKQSWQQGLIAGLDALVTIGLPVIIGEFGPGQNIGPSPTNIIPQDIIQAAEARGLGWMAWAWDDDPSAGDTWFALSRNGDYNAGTDLTTFGKSVVEATGYGLLALAKPATMF